MSQAHRSALITKLKALGIPVGKNRSKAVLQQLFRHHSPEPELEPVDTINFTSKQAVKDASVAALKERDRLVSWIDVGGISESTKEEFYYKAKHLHQIATSLSNLAAWLD